MEDQPPVNKQTSRKWETLKDKRLWGIGLALLCLVLCTIWLARLYRTARSLQAHLAEAEALASAEDPLEKLRSDPEAVGALLHGVRADVLALKRDVGWLAPLGPALRWVPEVGPLLAEGPDLLVLADGLTEAGTLLWDDFSPLLVALQSGLPSEEAFRAVFQDGEAGQGPRVAMALEAVQRAQSAYEGVEIAALPGRFQGPVKLLGTAFPLLEDGLPLLTFAPELIGMDRPRTYLVLALNETEIRPSGGFITGVGEIRVEAGEIMTMTFRDSYAVDDFSLPYPDPPELMRHFLAVDLWVFRDSNWSPDFPTSAREGLALYRPGYPVKIDGVVALDMQAVQQIIAAMAPLQVAGFDEPVTEETVMEYIYELWAPDDGKLDRKWWQQRKAFMGLLAQAVFERVQTGGVDWGTLLNTVTQLLEEKHLVLYFEEPAVEAFLVDQGWGGAMHPPQGDYLMVVEANLGFNKVTANIERSFSYDVDLSAASPQVSLTLLYTNTSTADYPCRPEARYAPTYELMMERCYWSVLRAYVPEGAQLIEASRHSIPAESVASKQRWSGRAYAEDAVEGAYTVFNQAVLLPTDSHAKVWFRYNLPEHVVVPEADGSFAYRLDLQKQIGLSPVPVRVALHLPQNAVLLLAEPEAVRDARAAKDVLVFDVDLKVDTQIVVRYSLSEGEK